MGGAAMVFMAMVTVASAIAILPFLDPLLSLLGAKGETLDLSQAVPHDRHPLHADDGARHLRHRHPARRRRRTPGDVCDALQRHRDRDPRSDPHFRARSWSRRGGDLHRSIARRHAGHRLVRRAHRPQSFGLSDPRNGCGRRQNPSSISVFRPSSPSSRHRSATPICMGALARFGDDAVAGMAVIGRLVPVCFVALFRRVRARSGLSWRKISVHGNSTGSARTMRDALLFVGIYVLIVWALMALFAHNIADLFGASGMARDVIVFFCYVRRRPLPLRRSDLHRQRRLQQSRQAALLDRPELGALDLGCHSFRVGRRSLVRRRGRACRFRASA